MKSKIWLTFMVTAAAMVSWISGVNAERVINPPDTVQRIEEAIGISLKDPMFNTKNLAATGSSISIRLNKKGDAYFVHQNERVLIEPSDVISDELIVLGGNLSIQGKIENDVIVFGGTVDVSGTIQGDLVIMAGHVNLEDSAKIYGNFVSFSGELQKAEGAYIENDEVNLSAFPFVSNLGSWIGRNIEEKETSFSVSPMRFLNTFSILWWAVVSFFAFLLVSRNLEDAGKLLRLDALKSLLIGFIFHVASLILVMFLLITLLGIPLIPVVALFWIAVNLFAVPLSFYVLGVCILERLNRHNTSVLSAMALGFIVLSLIRFLPFFIGFFIWHLWVMTAIGASITSKFGTLKPWFKSQPRYISPGENQSPPVPNNTQD